MPRWEGSKKIPDLLENSSGRIGIAIEEWLKIPIYSKITDIEITYINIFKELHIYELKKFL